MQPTDFVRGSRPELVDFETFCDKYYRWLFTERVGNVFIGYEKPALSCTRRR